MKKLLVICIALSVLFLLVAVVAADDMGKAQTVNGWVSDSKCGAKGANAGAFLRGRFYRMKFSPSSLPT